MDQQKEQQVEAPGGLPKDPNRADAQIAHIMHAVTLNNDLRETVTALMDLMKAETWLSESVEDVLKCVATHDPIHASSRPDYILALFNSPIVDFFEHLEKARTMNSLFPHLVKTSGEPETPARPVEESHAGE